MTEVSRRRLLGYSGVTLAAGAAAGAGLVSVAQAHEGPTYGDGAVEFFGAHQAGIATPVQDRLHFASFDVVTEDKGRLVRMLKEWTAAGAALTAGHPYGAAAGGLPRSPPHDTGGAVGLPPGPGARPGPPPDDTGEALALPPARLTLTVGFGPTLFEKDGKDRFGVKARRPAALADLPHFPGDNLDAARSGGDICVQACADDPQVAVHAIRNLARIGFGTVALRWSQLGFGRTSSTSTSQSTPRNLFGFKDGTANLKAEQPKQVDDHVWVPSGADRRADWLAGGSYMITRRINMNIEVWDRTSLREQENVIG